MTRRILATVMALGALITVMSFGGIYAVFSDRATTGLGTVDSAPLPPGVDIEIATAASAVSCAPGDYDDDLTTALFDVSDVKPGDDVATSYICVKNVGIADATLTWTVADLTNSEVDCTGDEAGAGDVSCGSGLGELGAFLYLESQRYDCATGTGSGGTSAAFLTQASLTTIPVTATGATLPAGSVLCFKIHTTYPGYATTSLTNAQLAQSDIVSWRFAIDATE